MSVTRRIYHAGPLAAGGEIELSAEAARHVVRVLRLRPGSELVVFDGAGVQATGRLVGTDPAVVRIETVGPGTAESPLDITLVQGISRGHRMDLVVQKATELGVSTLWPVMCARSVVRLDDQRAARRVQHWREVAVAACEQCGRSRLPEIRSPAPVAEAFAAVRGLSLVLDPVAGADLAGLPPPDREVSLLIGPEGGLTAAETAAARTAGFLPLRLGPRVLRTETAAIAALTAVGLAWGDLGRGRDR